MGRGKLHALHCREGGRGELWRVSRGGEGGHLESFSRIRVTVLTGAGCTPTRPCTPSAKLLHWNACVRQEEKLLMPTADHRRSGDDGERPKDGKMSDPAEFLRNTAVTANKKPCSCHSDRLVRRKGCVAKWLLYKERLWRGVGRGGERKVVSGERERGYLEAWLSNLDRRCSCAKKTSSSSKPSGSSADSLRSSSTTRTART
jgi:hypothetical protein